MTAYTKKWNGSAWVTAPFKKWNGSAWIDAYVWKWNGSAWTQLYPEPIVTTTQTINAVNMNTYRISYKDWKGDDTARQGSGESWDGSIENYGYMGISSSYFPGARSVTSISSAYISGTRGASGYYNNDQTIHFYRGSVVPTEDPTGTLLGEFTATTGGPGKDVAMGNRSISGYTNLRDWMNQVDGHTYLYIYSAVENEYLSIYNASITVTYLYSASTAMYTSLDAAPVAYNLSVSDYSEQGGLTSEIYHRMPIYLEEVDMSLQEVLDRREKLGIADIDITMLNESPEILPWFREKNIFFENGEKKFRIEVFNMRMCDEAQYSVDNITWNTLYGTGEGCYVQGTLPNDFNIYHDYIYCRIVDKQKEEIIDKLTVEPIIYIP